MVKNVLLLLLDALTEWLDPDRAKERAAWQTAYEQYQRAMKDNEQTRQSAATQAAEYERTLAAERAKARQLGELLEQQAEGYRGELQNLQTKLAALGALSDAAVLRLPISGGANGQA